MPTQNYQTYAVRSPLDTHYRHARCPEVNCEAYLNGWQLRVENLSPELLHTARYSGRRFHEMQVAEGETYLVFEAGQSCFAESTHQIALDRPEFFYVGRGDHRSFTTRKATRVGDSEEWLERFEANLDNIRKQLEKG